MQPHSHRNWGDYATGAVPHVHDPSDYRMQDVPGVAAQAAIGVPETYDLRPIVKQLYQQGSVPCCVMASIALMESIQDQVDRANWRMYDFLEAYHSIGGNDHDGVPTRSALQYAQDTGLRVQAATDRHRIASYAFAPQEPKAFVDTLKASIASNRAVVVACRLPEKFGWISSGPRTEAYHQWVGVGYGPPGIMVANSWGPLWGQGGFGWVGWDYLTADNLQNGDCYAATTFDLMT